VSNLLDSVIKGLDATTRCASSEVPPTAVLWTDAKSEWLPLLEQLKARLPQLLVLGEYAPDKRTGPAIWLKCAMQGVLPEVDFPKGKTPILYLPGVSRQELRAGTQCPWELQPLVELLYRGTVWAQKNGRDWTVEAMLVSKESPALGLDVSGSANTKLSMMASLAVLAITPVSKLEGRRLEAEDFDRLMIGDHPRDLLRWMSNPQEVRAEMVDGKWHAFCNRCRDEYGFDPDTDGEIVAGEKLGLQETTSWETLWSRFREAPTTYSGVATTLRKAKPQSRLRFDREYWPDENEHDEDALRKALLELATVDQGSARTEIAKLEQHHGVRRTWVWAKLGQAPMACALEFLAGLAGRTASHLGGDSIADLEKQYVQGGYLADDFALKALASVKATADFEAIEAAVRALYLPWLEHAAERFQDCVQREVWPNRTSSNRPSTIKAEVGTCLLFADGLRYDLAVRLTELLHERGYTTDENRRWAALPSVTATAKPAVSPIAEKLEGRGLPDSFTPDVVDAGESKPLTHARLQSLLETEGYQIISSSEVGDPAKPKARGWAETGEIDKRGHDLQIKLASMVSGQVEMLADRIVELLDAGWRKVRVVTDHGWLLMPGGLPKQELPTFLTEAKWSRCATIKGESKPDVDRHAWYWNPQAEFASASGIRCFSAGHCYQHGGVSLQECLVADIMVSPDVQINAQSANIAKIDWKGLRCRITVEPVVPGLQVDLRKKPNDPTTSIASGGKALDGNGTVTLFVEDEDLEGSVVAAVVCGEAGQVLAKQSTTVGGE
jgi:hypothetical protein